MSWRAQIYRWNGDIRGRSIRWTVRKFDREPTFVTAVLAAMGHNRPDCAFSDCCRPAFQEVGIRGDEHSSGRQGVSVSWRKISVAALHRYDPRFHPRRSEFERSNALMPALEYCLVVSYLKLVNLSRQTLVERPPF